VVALIAANSASSNSDYSGPSPVLRAAANAIAHGARVCRWVQPRLFAGGGSLRAERAEPPDTQGWKVIKADASPVTVADLACQGVVNTELMNSGLIAGPMDRDAPGMLGEESGSILTGADAGGTMDAVLAVLRGSGVMESITGDDLLRAIDAAKVAEYRRAAPLPERYWTLDPIDGTKGFIKGRAYAVCLALIERGQPTVCALACPKLNPDRLADALEPHAMGCLVLAERLSRPGSAGRHDLDTFLWGPVWSVPFAADGSPDWDLADAQPALPEVPSGAQPRWTEGLERSPRDVRVLDQVMRVVGGSRTIAMDSQAKYATVSRGQSDVYLRPAPRSWGMRVWDHAAGVGLCQASGRLATDLRGHPVEFSTGYALSGQGMLVAPPGLQNRILEALAGIPDAFAAEDWVP